MKNKFIIYIIVIIAIIAVAAAVDYQYMKKRALDKSGIACTREVKLCPDGSFVGRSGPNCEFAACPAAPIAGWVMGSDKEQGIEYQYPEKLPTSFIDGFVWPPKIVVATGTFSCVVTPPTSSLPERVSSTTIAGRSYCVMAKTGAAAGSAYTEYVYAAQIDDKTINISFTVRYPSCDNYVEPNRSACAKERTDFNLDALIDRIATSVRLSR